MGHREPRAHVGTLPDGAQHKQSLRQHSKLSGSALNPYLLFSAAMEHHYQALPTFKKAVLAYLNRLLATHPGRRVLVICRNIDQACEVAIGCGGAPTSFLLSPPPASFRTSSGSSLLDRLLTPPSLKDAGAPSTKTARCIVAAPPDDLNVGGPLRAVPAGTNCVQNTDFGLIDDVVWLGGDRATSLPLRYLPSPFTPSAPHPPVPPLLHDLHPSGSDLVDKYALSRSLDAEDVGYAVTRLTWDDNSDNAALFATAAAAKEYRDRFKREWMDSHRRRDFTASNERGEVSGEQEKSSQSEEPGV